MDVQCTKQVTIDIRDNKLSLFWSFIRGTWKNKKFSYLTIGGSGGHVSFSLEELPKLIDALNEMARLVEEE